MGAVFFGHVLPNGGVGKMILCLLAAGAAGGVLAANVKKTPQVIENQASLWYHVLERRYKERKT